MYRPYIYIYIYIYFQLIPYYITRRKINNDHFILLINQLKDSKRRVFAILRLLNDSYTLSIYKKSAVTFISSILQSLTNVLHRFF